MDDESPYSDAKFQVYLDGKLVFDSGDIWWSFKKRVDLDVEGKSELKLVTRIVGSPNGDHTDWAGARLTKYKTTSTKLYEYDGFNQLSKVAEGTNVYEYSYGGDGLRLSKTINGVKTIHVWDGQQMVAELNSSGAITSRYIRGINQIYVQDQAGTKKFYLFNGHGDVVHLTNTSGSVIKTYDYDVFGVEKNPDSNDTNPFRYCGEYFDKETGTIYLRARYYNPAIGRFINEDPIFSGLNWYTYANNNPIMFIDPLGLEAIIVSGSEYDAKGRFKYNFIEPAITALKNLKSNNPDEKITWVISSAGYSKKDIKNFNKIADEIGVEIKFISNKDELFEYINTGGVSADYRKADPITNFGVFSHGLVGSVALGYGQSDDVSQKLNITINDLSNIKSYAFSNTTSWFASCNTGTKVKGNNSFAQEWVNITGGTATAVVDGTTYYGNINQWQGKTRLDGLKYRISTIGYGFNPNGSRNLPQASSGVNWYTFTKQ